MTNWQLLAWIVIVGAVLGAMVGVGLTWGSESRVAGFLVGGGAGGFLGLIAVGIGKS